MSRETVREIKKLLIEKDMKQNRLAEMIGKNPANLSNQLRRANFTESDLRKIADALECGLEIRFVRKGDP